MTLESGKIYLRKYFPQETVLLPTLELTGNVEVYVSNKPTKPASISEMKLSEDFENNKINSVVGMTRWIAVVYSSGSSADEMGLVENPFRMD